MGHSTDTRVLIADLPLGTDLIDIHRAFPHHYPHLFLSSARHAQTGRFDILFAAIDETRSIGADAIAHTDFFSIIDAEWRAQRIARAGSDIDLPFRGGWAIFLAYEIAQQIEPRLRLPLGKDLPIAFMQRCPGAVIIDHAQNRCTAVVEAGYATLLQRIVDDYHAAPAAPPVLAVPRIPIIEEDENIYLQGVRRCQQYIAAGDVFQVNLSRAWQVAAHLENAHLMTQLMRHNPAPFSALFTHPAWAIASSSPERLVAVRDGQVETRPIAGTRPRGRGQADHALAQELLAHPKERAEHVMLVDLERNDMGRICATGSIRVAELMGLESYAHVHHIVSHITGRLRDHVTPGAVLRALFPGGTITGCPKVRCMEIIAELEHTPRQAYTGSVGYLNRDGDMDFNILIRSLHTQAQGWTWRTGAGIVYDSDPQRELQETRAKARGLLLALHQDDLHVG
ncbi:MAG: aminodeoxychorismate synthase component I [Pseudomonadota bacterium]